MKNFDDLVDCPDEELQILIRMLTPSTLAMALKTASREVVVKFFVNMSRGAEGLIEDMMEKLQNPTADEIAMERKKILEFYHGLKSEGKLSGR